MPARAATQIVPEPAPEPGPGLTAAVHDALLRELAARPGGTWVTCAGSSMEPTIRRGDRVRVEACTRARAGDVVLLAARSGGHVLHRVVLAMPGTGWFAHTGDAGGEPALAHVSQLVGRAPLPRLTPRLPARAAAIARAMVAARRVAGRALRGRRDARRDAQRGPA